MGPTLCRGKASFLDFFCSALDAILSVLMASIAAPLPVPPFAMSAPTMFSVLFLAVSRDPVHAEHPNIIFGCRENHSYALVVTGVLSLRHSQCSTVVSPKASLRYSLLFRLNLFPVGICKCFNRIFHGFRWHCVYKARGDSI